MIVQQYMYVHYQVHICTPRYAYCDVATILSDNAITSYAYLANGILNFIVLQGVLVQSSSLRGARLQRVTNCSVHVFVSLAYGHSAPAGVRHTAVRLPQPHDCQPRHALLALHLVCIVLQCTQHLRWPSMHWLPQRLQVQPQLQPQPPLPPAMKP